MEKKYSKLQLAAIVLLLLSLTAQALTGMFHSSVVWDEPAFIGQGKAIFSTGYMSFMILADHPPLSYYISSIPLIPLKFDEKIWDKKELFKIGYDVLFNSGYNYKKILILSRFPFLILSVISALYVLKWAAEAYGPKSGIFALFLYSFNPSIISYSGLATADFTVAAMIFIATYYFWKYLNEQSVKNILLTAIFFGLAQLSKITAFVLVPLFAIIGFVAVRNNKKIKLNKILKHFAVMILIAFFLMWAFHKFQFGTMSNNLPQIYYADKARQELGKIPVIPNQLLFVYDKVPLPMPIYFGMVGNVVYLSSQEKENFVFGEITNKSIWYMGLLSFLLKTPIPLLIMLAIIFIFFKKLKLDKLTSLTLIIPIVLIFITFSANNKLSGIRHLLAIYPFIFVLAGSITNIRMKRRNAIVYSLSLLYLLSALLVAPYYLSYMNILAGGPANAYKIMVGANIDQGQELLGLKDFMQKNNIGKIKLSYWGSVDPKNYGINYEYLPSPYFQPWQNNYTHIVQPNTRVQEDCSERKGWIAISVTNLQNVHLANKECYDWLKKYEPVKRIGYSIFVYDVK